MSDLPSEQFREYLLTRNLRLTRERSVVVEEVFADDGHIEIEHLVRRLAERGISRATAYRTLMMLEDAGMV